MNNVTAEMIERGRGIETGRSAQRRDVTAKMQEAREKLTSSGSGYRTFDVELLRVFAERRQSAMPALLGLALLTAGLATRWVPVTEALAWLIVMLSVVMLGAIQSRQFLHSDMIAARPVRWQRRFVLAELVQGAGWASIVPLVISHNRSAVAEILVLFGLILAGAMTAMSSASIPLCVYAGLSPMILVIVGLIRPAASEQSLALLIVAAGSQIYFMILAHQLHSTSLNTLSIQADKDALIVELEQAKLNSDEARRRAEEASLAKSRFLATMSHELRTPLNAILGFSEVMKGELFGAHSVAVYRDYSADIHSSGQHLLMLINEILDLSRVEAGRYELKEEPIVLAHIVEECRHLLTLRAAKREITLNELIEQQLPRIWADERAIRQVVLNLLSNAIKFTPQGGVITIKVGWTAQGGQYVSIRDTGPGIPEAEIPVVMSPFGRGTLAQKNAEEGSGLGLPIVNGLVELHGGSFILRSKVREGTEVIVIMPPERIMNALPQLNPDDLHPVPARPGERRWRPAA